MPRYVKFVQGTPEAFAKLPRKDSDTLYVIFEEDEINATLYLGSKIIAGGEGFENVNLTLLLSQLKDIQLTSKIADNSILVYDVSVGSWINKETNELLFVGATATSSGVAGLVPPPEAGTENAFLCSDGEWKTIGIPGSKEYNASNIYFENNLISNYDIGNVKIGRDGNAVIAAAGKSVAEVFDIIFGGEKDPNNNIAIAKPLDANGYFTEYAAAAEAAEGAGPAGTLGTYNYHGQLLTVIENNQANLYVIQPNGALEAVAAISDIPEKVDTYTKSEIDSKVTMAAHLKRKMINTVEEIGLYAEVNADAEQYIYMVPTGLTLTDNRYDEYMIIPVIDEDGVEIQAIERVGTWEVDLTDYSKASDLVALTNRVIDLETRIATLEATTQGQT